MKIKSMRVFIPAGVVGVWLLGLLPAAAATWTYDFKQGLDPYFWAASSYGNTAFTFTTTENGLRVAGGSGGSGFQAGHVKLNLDSFPGGLTDFDAELSFTNAAFSPPALHQVQFEISFPEPRNPLGYTYLVIVKDPDDFHVWRDPPQSEANHTYTSATSGKMRFVRSGASVAAYLNGSATPFWSGTYGTNALDYFTLGLNKNSTSVATEVTWTEFSITPAPAAAPTIAAGGLADGAFALNWIGTAQTPVTVERCSSLALGDWRVVSRDNTARAFSDTNSPAAQGFYRVVVPSPPYLVVDLSGGSAAEAYPVSYLDAVPPDGWTDEHKTTKLVLRRIPADAFTMGSPEDELGRFDVETQHAVTLTKDFYIGVFEVTQRQWELVMGNRPSYFNNTTYYPSRPVEQVSYYDIRENPANSDDPAVDWPNNSAVNAGSFMGRLRAKTGLSTFDLPTEAQWEHACRAGTGTALNSGKNLTAIDVCPNMAEVGRYWSNGGSAYSPGGDTGVGTAKSGSYLPNAWGLHDMHGNVWEWCLDWYGAYPGSAQDPPGSASGPDRAGRGGSWWNGSRFCRSAYRGHYLPGSRYSDFGFRAAMTQP